MLKSTYIEGSTIDTGNVSSPLKGNDTVQTSEIPWLIFVIIILAVGIIFLVYRHKKNNKVLCANSIETR